MPKKAEVFKTTATKGKKGREKTILNARVKRHNGRLSLYLKSKVMEEFFKHNSTGRTSGVAYNDIEAYENTGGIGSNNAVFNEWGHPSLFYNSERINASFLRAVGLSKGVTIEISMVASRERIESFLESLKAVTVELYRDYIKPIDIYLEVTSKEVYVI